MKKILIGCGLGFACVTGLMATDVIDVRTYFSSSVLSKSDIQQLEGITKGLNTLHLGSRAKSDLKMRVVGNNVRRLAKRKPDAPIVMHELARYIIVKECSVCDADGAKRGYAKAEAILKTSLENDPEYATNYILLGHVYANQNRPLAAKTALQKAYDLNSDDPWLDYNWASILVSEKKYDEALGYFETIILSESNKDNGKILLASLQDAIKIYNTKRGALGTTPNYVVLDKLESSHQKVLTLNPAQNTYHRDYAEFLLCWRDDYTGAQKHAKKALKLSNNQWNRRMYGGTLYRKWADDVVHDRPNAGQKAYDRAWAVYPYLGDVAYDMNCHFGYKTYEIIAATEAGENTVDYQYWVERATKYSELYNLKTALR